MGPTAAGAQGLSSVQLLAAPWTIACQVPLPEDSFSQEYLHGVPFCSPRGLPTPGIKPTSLMSPKLAGRFFTTNATGEASVVVIFQLLSCLRLFATPWTAALQAFLSFTISWSLLKLMSIESVMPSNHLIPFSSCPQSFPASGSFPVSRLFTSFGQSIGASASASIPPVNIQGGTEYQDL